MSEQDKLLLELAQYKEGYEQANTLCSKLMEMSNTLQKQVETMEGQMAAEKEKFAGERDAMKKQFANQLNQLQEQARTEQSQIAAALRSEQDKIVAQKDQEIDRLQGQLSRLFEHHTNNEQDVAKPSEPAQDQQQQTSAPSTTVDIGLLPLYICHLFKY